MSDERMSEFPTLHFLHRLHSDMRDRVDLEILDLETRALAVQNTTAVIPFLKTDVTAKQERYKKL